jgi:integrase
MVWRTRLIPRTGCLRRYRPVGHGANGTGCCRKANPAAKIARFREEGRERFLTSGELSRLGDALVQCEARLGPHASGAIRLLCLTGARLNEVLALRWQEVDFERGLALLPDSKTGRKIVQLSAPALAVLDSLPRLDSCHYVIAGMARAAGRLAAPLGVREGSSGARRRPPARFASQLREHWRRGVAWPSDDRKASRAYASRHHASLRASRR